MNQQNQLLTFEKFLNDLEITENGNGRNETANEVIERHRTFLFNAWVNVAEFKYERKFKQKQQKLKPRKLVSTTKIQKLKEKVMEDRANGCFWFSCSNKTKKY